MTLGSPEVDDLVPRSVCDYGLGDLPAISPKRRWLDVLEPGDLLFFRTEASSLSRAICAIDGYWSHSAIYVGADEIAHTTSKGLATASLRAFSGFYNDGIAFVRPNRPAEDRLAAAQWAKRVAGPGPSFSSYAGDHLGVTFGLLTLPRFRRALDRVPLAGFGDIAGFDWAVEKQVNWVLGRSMGQSVFDGTCSGFVYQAYLEATGAPLRIQPSPGLGLDGEDFVIASTDGGSAQWMAKVGSQRRQQQRDNSRSMAIEDWLAPFRSFRAPTLDKLELTFSLLPAAVFGFALTYTLDQGVPVAEAVTPGDLWLSPDEPLEAGFLTEHHRREALDEIAHCLGD